MDFLVSFAVFVVAMAISLMLDCTMLLPLLLGLVMFTAVALHRGFPLRQVAAWALGSLRDSLIVVEILLLIGCLTGMWRCSGTVAYFLIEGIGLIPPGLFLLAAFLLTAIMSFALGTSFGVTATAGVILISIARAGGVNTVLAAGAIMSGVYVGDRGSPAASSANLVAVLTGTDIRDNVKRMLKDSWLPFLICCGVYGVLSGFSPMQQVNSDILEQMEQLFSLNIWCLLPAGLMILLPFCRVKVKIAMAVSLVSSICVAMIVQGQGIGDCLRAALLGYTPADASLSGMLGGGGMISMLEICGILMISGTYGGIFRGTNMLSGVSRVLSRLSRRMGRYTVMLLMSFLICGLFCNQTIGIIMQTQLSQGLYKETEEEKVRKMLDIENSVILSAGLVPWCIACSVPLTMLGADIRSLPFAFYLWLIPGICLLRRNKEQK